MAGWAAAAAAVIGAVMNKNSQKDAAKKQLQGQDAALAATLQAQEDAKAAAIPLYTAAQQNALRGIQASMDVFQGTIPGQMLTVREANMAAQQNLLAGLEHQKAALLGTPTEGLPQFQQFQAPLRNVPNVGFTVPDFTSISDALGAFGGATDFLRLGNDFTDVNPNFVSGRGQNQRQGFSMSNALGTEQNVAPAMFNNSPVMPGFGTPSLDSQSDFGFQGETPLTSPITLAEIAAGTPGAGVADPNQPQPTPVAPPPQVGVNLLGGTQATTPGETIQPILPVTETQTVPPIAPVAPIDTSGGQVFDFGIGQAGLIDPAIIAQILAQQNQGGG